MAEVKNKVEAFTESDWEDVLDFFESKGMPVLGGGGCSGSCDGECCASGQG